MVQSKLSFQIEPDHAQSRIITQLEYKFVADAVFTLGRVKFKRCTMFMSKVI